MMGITRFVTAVAASLTLAGASAPGTAALAPWSVDPSHTRVGFSVRHFFTPIDGQFDTFTLTLDWDRSTPSRSRVEAHIDVASVNTNNAKRDAHLRSPDFFDAATHASIDFKSTSVRALDAERFVATGELRIKGVARTVDVPVRLLGVKEIPAEMQGMMGGVKRIASFEGTLVLDRRHFGVGTGSWGETAIVGADVEVRFQVEASEK